MATLFVDLESGNDNYGGDSFVLTDSGADGSVSGSTLTATGGGFTALQAAEVAAGRTLVGRRLSINNGTIYAHYAITAVPTDTTLTLAALSGGTALATITTPKQWYIGGPLLTTNAGLTAVRVVPGDVVRYKATPTPTTTGQNATWTNLSRTVTLTTAVTANINLCDAAWTAAGSQATSTTSATRKQGVSFSTSITVATAAVANQLLAYTSVG
ncbi:MAG: hypothetical protein M3349_04135, partial [Actinomycetota bacterium]|nr:hypothetical protein [Actinomycetota bacterium]